MKAAIPQFLGWLGLLLGLSILVAVLRSPHRRGRAGERLVARLFRKALADEPHQILRDVTLLTERGSSQIDMLALTTRGIFVVEIKNLSGKISGGPQRKNWWVWRRHRAYRLGNPVHQNHGHMKAVQQLLGISRQLLVPVVVITGRATLSNPVRKLVLRPAEIRDAIHARSQDCLDSQALHEYAQTLETARLPPGRATDRQHRQNIARSLRARRGPLACPRCGSAMQKRTTTRGRSLRHSFWGCENFPRCRGTRALTSRGEPVDSEFPAQTELRD